MINEPLKLSKKQRVMRARWEYIKGVVCVWNKLKEKHDIDDGLLYELLENPCELDPRPEWESELDKLREELEKKYNVCIEHEDDVVKCFAW